VIGLDSNVLVRYLTQDDPLQSKKANQLIERTLDMRESLYLNHIVLCEVSWVLGRSYKYTAGQIVDVVEQILSAAQFEFENKELLWRALATFRDSGADFADCLVGAKNSEAGCGKTLTFDQRAARLPQFSLR